MIWNDEDIEQITSNALTRNPWCDIMIIQPFSLMKDHYIKSTNKYGRMESGVMDTIKNDTYYIEKIMKDMQILIDRTVWMTVEELTECEVLYDSLLFRLIQISENCDKLTPAFKECHNTIPWQSIKDIGNKIIYESDEVELVMIYQMVMEDIPRIYEKLEQII